MTSSKGDPASSGRPDDYRFYPPVPPLGVPEPLTQQQGAAATGSSATAPVAAAEGKPGGKPPGDMEAGYPAGDGAYQQPGYPPAQPYGQGYQQGQGQQPGGYLASAMPPGAGGAGDGGVVQGIPVWGRVQSYVSSGERDSPGMACCAWAIFVLGIFMPWFWVVNMLLPCCFGRSMNVRRAAVAASMALCVYLVLAIILLPTMLVPRYRHNRGYGYNCGPNGRSYCG